MQGKLRKSAKIEALLKKLSAAGRLKCTQFAEVVWNRVVLSQ